MGGRLFVSIIFWDDQKTKKSLVGKDGKTWYHLLFFNFITDSIREIQMN